MPTPDLRLLALVDAKVLPPEVQDPYDHWRIWRAREAVTALVRKRLRDLPIVLLYLERLEEADDEKTIFEGIYALAEVVEVYRQQLGLHSQYLVLVMSIQLNPWGMLEFTKSFAQPSPTVIQAVEELWRLLILHQVDADDLLAKITPDETFHALEAYYHDAATPTNPAANRKWVYRG